MKKYLDTLDNSNRVKLIQEFNLINKKNKFNLLNNLQNHLIKHKIEDNIGLLNNIINKINLYFNCKANIQYINKSLNEIILPYLYNTRNIKEKFDNYVINLNDIDNPVYNDKNIYYINDINDINNNCIQFLRNTECSFIIDLNIENINIRIIHILDYKYYNDIFTDDYLIKIWTVLNYKSIFI